jgi:hypothetical protein
MTELRYQKSASMQNNVKCRIRACEKWTLNKDVYTVVYIVDFADVFKL